MKIKYYLNKKLIKLMLISVLISILLIQNSQALTLDSSSGNPYKIFACQPTIVYANFSGGVPDDVFANVYIDQTIIEHQVQISQYTNVTMSNLGGGIWSGTFGNDQNLHWGRRSILFNTHTGGVLTQFAATNVVFVMNSNCVGTDKTNYTQIPPSGLGNFSRLIWTNPNMNILDMGLYYWLAAWGYMFYVLVMFTICLSFYMKSQSIVTPLIAAIVMLLFGATSNIVPHEYRNWILVLLGICIGAIYVKFFVKD